MAILKCKMCGGDIVLNEEKTLGMCEYCGSTMTLPKVSDDQRAARFNRGNHFRRQGDFDKALAVYETIVNEDDTDAEAHWCCALCRFGIEYVEDPNTYEYLPTCHRASFDSFLEDPDYLAALEYSDGITKRQYQKDAAKIAEVQRGILATSQGEEPFDVFICYKETDDQTKERTRDSLDAQDIYYQLTQEGYRVFFSRITLEDKVGAEYEPYIFAALNSAKVMIALGSKPEYFNAVWVKNEWSRFLAMMRKDRSKILLPCYKDMDPYDLPEQLGVLQSYDMAKIGFMQDLIRGIKKVLQKDEPKAAVKETVVVQGNANIAPLLKRGMLALEDGEWEKANEFFDQALNSDAECAEAYVGLLMADLKVRRRADLKNQAQPFNNNNNYNKAIRFADASLKKELTGYISFINDRNEKEKRRQEEEQRRREEERRKRIYDDTSSKMKKASTEDEYSQVAKSFRSILDYKDASSLAKQCEEKAEAARKDTIYSQATAEMKKDSLEGYYVAKEKLNSIKGWKDADEQLSVCETRIKEIVDQKAAEERLAAEKKKRLIRIIGSIAAAVIVIVVAFVIVYKSVIIPNNIINDAKSLANKGDYQGAVEKLKEIPDNQTAKELTIEYLGEEAKTLEENGRYPEAAYKYMKAGSTEKAKSLYWEYSRTTIISAGYDHTVGLKADGTVVAAGSNGFGQCGVSEWNDIAAVSAGWKHTVGLKADGTVVAVGVNDESQCNVQDWTDIVAVSAGRFHTVGLKADGTVVAVGYNNHSQCDVASWTDIVAVSAGTSHTVGLKADGTVVAVGYNNHSQCDVQDWTDIVAVSAGGYHTVGLKSDGSVVAVGDNKYSQCDVSGWNDIIAVSAGAYHTVGLKADGTVIAVGDNSKGQCDCESWKDIVAVSAGYDHTIGYTSDGEVVAVGNNLHGQCNVSDWILW